jgi:hypothetical protein
MSNKSEFENDVSNTLSRRCYFEGKKLYGNSFQLLQFDGFFFLNVLNGYQNSHFIFIRIDQYVRLMFLY